MTPPRLEMRGIAKRFGGVVALKSVDVVADAGAVHAICGENGAGKSTLMKILAGAITEYEGEVLLDGQVVRFKGPADAEQRGIGIIYQELNLVPDLSAAANIYLGREPAGPLGWLDDRAMEAETARGLARLGMDINPRTRVRDLRIGDQQMVEIAKALALNATILIMDEPTSALSDAEVARLYEVIDALRAEGVTVLYISHKMDEVFRLADRVTVLRDGQHVQTLARQQARPRQVINLMVGRAISDLQLEGERAAGPEVLRVEDLALPSVNHPGQWALDHVSFALRRGEILGVAGLLGAGRTELLEALFGASPTPPAGRIILDGRPRRFRHPHEAMAAGLALVTEDRKNLGLFTQMSVAENITMCHLDAVAAAGFINRRRERAAAAGAIDRLGIKTRGGAMPVTSLSGGNQQKCILARWLLTRPAVLLLDEPTRGIDVGAKAEIYKLLHQLCREGLGIIMTSSELPELLTVADRIMVLCEGRKTAEFARAEATEQAILHAAMQFSQAEP